MIPRKITIDYCPQEYQRKIHDDDHRFKVLNMGRRGGKTEISLNELIRKNIKHPGLYWYVGPSYRQAKNIAWVRLKTLLKPAREFWKFNEQELYAEDLNTGGRIELKGADNEESLLGVGLQGVVMDEAAMQKQTVWPRIIRPMLMDSQGWAFFISTPKGLNWFYDLFKKGMDPAEKDWVSWKYPTAQNRYIEPAEIEQMRQELPERVFLQEVLAEFLDDSSTVFKGLKDCLAGSLKMPVPGRFYTMGVDLAKSHDFTVLIVMDSVTRELVFFDRFQSVSWAEQKLRIIEIAAKYNNALCNIDSTGLGDPIVEDLFSAGVSVHHEDGKPGFKFTNTKKRQLIEHLCVAIEQRMITIPRKLDVLVDELTFFGFEVLAGGNIRYEAPDGKHDDCVISLALAVWLLKLQLKEAQMLKAEEERVLTAEDAQGRGYKVPAEIEDEADYEYVGY